MSCLQELIFIRHMEQCLAHGECCVSLCTTSTITVIIVKSLFIKQKHRLDQGELGSNGSTDQLE